MTNWPHAPNHQLTEVGAYMITGGTYLKKPVFQNPARLQYLHDLLIDITAAHLWQLEAWAVFSNHYHFVAQSPEDPASLRTLTKKLHIETAKWVNRLDNAAGRRVWFNFWDSHLTYERSYLARLHYVHTNPVHHGVVQVSTAYPWCSAAWFERTASPAFQRTLASFPTNRINVIDDF